MFPLKEMIGEFLLLLLVIDWKRVFDRIFRLLLAVDPWRKTRKISLSRRSNRRSTTLFHSQRLPCAPQKSCKGNPRVWQLATFGACFLKDSRLGEDWYFDTMNLLLDRKGDPATVFEAINGDLVDWKEGWQIHVWGWNGWWGWAMVVPAAHVWSLTLGGHSERWAPSEHSCQVGLRRTSSSWGKSS